MTTQPSKDGANKFPPAVAASVYVRLSDAKYADVFARSVARLAAKENIPASVEPVYPGRDQPLFVKVNTNDHRAGRLQQIIQTRLGDIAPVADGNSFSFGIRANAPHYLGKAPSYPNGSPAFTAPKFDYV